MINCRNYTVFIFTLFMFSSFSPSVFSQGRDTVRVQDGNVKESLKIENKKNPSINIRDGWHENIIIVDGVDNKSHLNPLRFGALSAITIGAVVGLHTLQQHAWWNGQRGQFHIQNDWAYAMSMDKIGHFMEGGLIEKTMKGAFIWSGMSERSAMWFGALFSIGYMTDIEIEDGFATKWGYSPGDEIANLSGDIFAITQDLWKPLRTVNIKWSYVPTNDPLHKGDFPDDYNGQVFWLSFTVHDYFGDNLKKYWPDFMNLAVGYGVKEYENYGPGGRIQNLYFGFDFNLEKLIPGDTKFIRFVKGFLNTFKIIPTPALKWNTTSGKVNFVVH